MGVSAGSTHSVALKPDGTVWTWGEALHGKLGHGDSWDCGIPTQVAGLNDGVAVAAGRFHSLAVLSNGTVRAWGYNYNGQLGTGTNGVATSTNRPVQVSDMHDAVGVAAGGSHSLALLSNGTVWAWGRGEEGQLGNSSNSPANRPVRVSILTNIVGVAAGYNSSFALESDGSMWAWGANGTGQLGINSTTPANRPIKVSALSNVVAIAAGMQHTVALQGDGTVWTWGANGSGQLGIGVDGGTRNYPVRAGGGILPYVIGIGVGYDYTMAVDTNGTVWTWGGGGNGCLGHGTNGSTNIPVAVTGLSNVVAVSGGDYHTMAVEADGTLWSWGNNGNGRLGEGTTTDRWSPVQVMILEFIERVRRPMLLPDGGQYLTGQVVTVTSPDPDAHLRYTRDGSEPTEESPSISSGGTLYIGTTTVVRVRAFKAGVDPSLVKSALYEIGGIVSAGSSHNVALKPDGTVWTWGYQYYGKLGLGDTTDLLIPTQVSGLDSAVSVAAGGSHSLAAGADGTVWAWGYNSEGQLGIGTNGVSSFTNRPVRLELNNVVAVAAGDNHSLALLSNGTVQAWGRGAEGQLGNGSNAKTNQPVQVQGLSNVVAIAAGYNYSLALKSDGSLWSWGANGYGQLGIGIGGGQNVPRQVPLVDVVAMAAGSQHSVALKGDGTVWTWGANGSGQLGIGVDGGTRNYPVRAGGGILPYVIGIGVGYDYTMAVDTNGTVWTWGGGGNGCLGHGTNGSTNIPVAVTGLSNVVAVSGGDYHTMAVEADGTLWSWGNNGNGRLGEGTTTDRWSPVQVMILEFIERVRRPMLLPDGGQYLTGQVVTVTSPDPDAHLRYTRDGSEPTEESPSISSGGTLYIGTTTVVRVRAFKMGTALSPVKSAVFTIGSAVAAGYAHSMAINSNGIVLNWGDNNYGQLGLQGSEYRLMPAFFSPSVHFVGIGTGKYHSHALRPDETMWSFGYNEYGQLGIGSVGGYFNTPQSMLHMVAMDKIVDFDGGESHSIIADRQGRVWTWGRNSSGQ